MVLKLCEHHPATTRFLLAVEEGIQSIWMCTEGNSGITVAPETLKRLTVIIQSSNRAQFLILKRLRDAHSTATDR